MNRISAAENLIIEYDAHRWRLLAYNEDGDERTLLEALTDAPLRYADEFARSRRLPTNGALPLQYVWQVVLGWSQDDEAWHLGLLLVRDIADARGSRWCHLAIWPDPDTTVFNDMAQQTGEALAAILQRPFNLILPQKARSQTAPLPALPLKIGDWQLEAAAENQLQFVRSRRWITTRVTRILWYLLWAAVYIVLSVATLSTDLALPNAGTMLPSPEVLPYLGLGAAAVLIAMILYIIYELLSRPNRIVIDGNGRRIAALRGHTEKWNHSSDELQGIYATQIVNRRGAKRKVYHAEINLHLGGTTFHRVIKQAQHEEDLHEITDGPAREAVIPLTPSGVISDLQAATLHIARVLGGLPAWYDQRVR